MKNSNNMTDGEARKMAVDKYFSASSVSTPHKIEAYSEGIIVGYKKAMEEIRKMCATRRDSIWESLPDADSDEETWTHEEIRNLGYFEALEWIEDDIDDKLHMYRGEYEE